MAMTLRLSDEDDRLLTERAAKEHRSKHDLVTEAVHVFLTEREAHFNQALERGMEKHKDLLDRLAK